VISSKYATLSCVLLSLKSGKTIRPVISVLLGSPTTPEKSNVSSSHSLVFVFATLISPVDPPAAFSNLIPTSLITV
jgi:hypothetical protein